MRFAFALVAAALAQEAAGLPDWRLPSLWPSRLRIRRSTCKRSLLRGGSRALRSAWGWHRPARSGRCRSPRTQAPRPTRWPVPWPNRPRPGGSSEVLQQRRRPWPNASRATIPAAEWASSACRTSALQPPRTIAGVDDEHRLGVMNPPASKMVSLLCCTHTEPRVNLQGV